MQGSLSAHDGGQVEDPLAECPITFDAGLSDGTGAIDALGKDAPCDLLWNLDVGGRLSLQRWHERPVRVRFCEQPCAAAVAEDFERDHGCGRGIDHLKRMRKAADEAIQNRVVKVGRHDAGSAGGFANLLLVVPALGEFARRVEPVERCGFTGPTDVEDCRREGIERFVEVGALAAGEVHQFDQNSRAEATIDGDAFAIETVYETEDVLRGADLDLLDEAMIANHGELAQNGIEHVSGDVPDLPGGRDGLKIPFIVAEGAEQFDKLCVNTAKQGSAEDGFGAGKSFGHEMTLWYRFHVERLFQNAKTCRVSKDKSRSFAYHPNPAPKSQNRLWGLRKKTSGALRMTLLGAREGGLQFHCPPK